MLQKKFVSQELFYGKPLTSTQEDNSRLNISEMYLGRTKLQSYPRRIVFELTNSCNINCVMCGRNYAKFSPSQLSINQFLWFKDLFHVIEEVTLMGWGEPTIHPDFVKMLKIIDQTPVRKYFCTNGMLLGELENAIFEYHVDLVAISINGASAKTNDCLRRGSDLDKIVNYIKSIVSRKKDNCSRWPQLSFVYCLMKSNLHELLPCIVLAQQLGVSRVKVVYFTTFVKTLFNETVWGMEQEVQRIFGEAEELANRLGVELKLPYISGQDSGGTAPHNYCNLPWRDLFIGADGSIRPCMSTSETLGLLDMDKKFLKNGIQMNLFFIEKMSIKLKVCLIPVLTVIRNRFVIGICKSHFYKMEILMLQLGEYVVLYLMKKKSNKIKTCQVQNHPCLPGKCFS